MSVSELICDYIYNTFRIIEASMEVAMRLASTLVTKLNSYIDSLFYTFKYVVDVALNTLVDALRTMQKMAIDLLWKKLRPDTFCKNLYKCSIILEDLADENSLIWKTCVKTGVIKGNTEEKRQFIYSIINDYNNFKVQICENGFTTSFGVDALKKLVDDASEKVDAMIRFLAKKKEAARRTIQKFLDDIENLGIFDLLAKIRKYFNCILDDSKSCAHIASTSNYYNTVLSALHIEENGSTGYRLETSLNNKIMNGLDARITQIDNLQGQVKDLADDLVDPNVTGAACKAYDLSKNVFPSDLSWSDVGKMRLVRPSTYKDTWMKSGVVNYWKIKHDQFYEIFIDGHPEAKDYNWTMDYFLGNIRIDDTAGKAYVEFDGNEIEYDLCDKNNEFWAGKEHTANVGYFEMLIDADDVRSIQKVVLEDDEVVSTAAAAVNIAFETEDGKKMKDKFKSIYEKYPNTIPESELATSW